MLKMGPILGWFFLESEQIPKDFTEFSTYFYGNLSIEIMQKNLQKNNLEFFYHGNGQGLVGAGAIGYEFDDNTLEFELSKKQNLEKKEKFLQSASN